MYDYFNYAVVQLQEAARVQTWMAVNLKIFWKCMYYIFFI